MLIRELLDMKLGDVLEEFCFVFSPECDYLYGVSRWDDLMQMWEEYQLDEEACFDGESFLAWEMEVDFDEEVLTVDGLRRVLDCIGIKKKGESSED